MDGFNMDYSDSDSGDSWTILDDSPTYGDEAPELPVINQSLERNTPDSSIDKDEDTDGISIISDSEPESPISCEMVQEDINIAEQSRPAETTPSKFISFNTLPHNSNNHEASITKEDDFLGGNTGKHKTYVHKRNKRLGTVLNIIMLGSVITAAGVAIGHMWGARNECALHTTPSVNKILSNLYKLQEENAYLRNKLKELTLINSLQMQHKKLNTIEKLTFKQQRCKKIYEEPLNSKNTERITKCIDNEISNIADNRLYNHLEKSQNAKAFERDIEKLKHIYQQNRSWLDEEVAKRLKYEEDIKKIVKSPLSSITEEQKALHDNTKIQINVNNNQPKHYIHGDRELIDFGINSENNATDESTFTVKKITYADSLKSDPLPHKVGKGETIAMIDNDREDTIRRVKRNKDVAINDVNLSEEDLKKDNRYIGQKHISEKKKRDRQKLHKKQKRRNKYEQWEMKGGYMKDYDDFSLRSFQDNENILKNFDGSQLSSELETTHVNQLPKTDNIQNKDLNKKHKKTQTKNPDKDNKLNIKSDNMNWYDKRAVLRTQARKRLEQELFGDTSPSNAGWYFRRMQKREQCRAKNDNSTYKKVYKRNMNFKMKQ